MKNQNNHKKFEDLELQEFITHLLYTNSNNVDERGIWMSSIQYIRYLYIPENMKNY